MRPIPMIRHWIESIEADTFRPTIKSMEIQDYKIIKKLAPIQDWMIYRGCKNADSPTVIIKVLKGDGLLPAELARLKQGYESISKVDSDGLVKIIEIIATRKLFALVLEDFEGLPLKQLIDKNNMPDVESFLRIGIEISRTLGYIHKNGIIHQSITPENILIDQKDWKVKLTGFNFFNLVDHDIYEPGFLKNTLAYISPEQTGRMNRAIDYRTDLYSLGVVFYELVTGQTPFAALDPLELFHSHLAVLPLTPNMIRFEVPEMILKITLKLLAKTPENRYQNAFGLMYDMAECLKQVKETGFIREFELARRDVINKFIAPRKLYGREQEIDSLVSAFERISHGSIQLMLISGEPGIGKTALVNGILKPLLVKKGYFLMGKYEKFKKEIPYNAIIQAMIGFVRQVLSESEETIDAWKKKILSALGPNAKIMTNVIPNLELMIGKQPEPALVGPEEARDRFTMVMEAFFMALADKEHPITIFLDDLQWIDSASISMLEIIFNRMDMSYLLVLGAFRDNQVSSEHPLRKLLKDPGDGSPKVHLSSLGPLGKIHIEEMLDDCFKCGKKKAVSLGKIIYQKTAGNPFFINQFLETLHDGKFIAMDPEKGWQWDEEKIKAINITDNVVDLMEAKLSELPAPAFMLLKVCSCIGNRFDLDTIAHIMDKTIDDVLDEIAPAIDDGIIQFTGDMYIYQHERIHETVYSLTPPSEKALYHYKTARAALEKIDEDDDLKKMIFYITDQLNSGSTLISNRKELEELIGLNLKAGIKAKESGAFPQALIYFRKGIDLADEDFWDSQYALALALHEETAEAFYLCSDFKSMEEISNSIIKKAKSLMDTIRTYEIIIKALIAENKLEEAITIGIKVLRRLKMRLPAKPGLFPTLYYLVKLKLVLVGKNDAAIIGLHEMRDPAALARIQILSSIGTAAYWANSSLLPVLVCQMVCLSVRYGNSEKSPYYFAGYGFLMSALGRIDSGSRFGKIALALLGKLDAKGQEAKTNFVICAFISHWTEPVNSLLRRFETIHKKALETGDSEFACHSALLHVIHMFLTGRNLDETNKKMREYGESLKRLKQTGSLNVIRIFQETVSNLISPGDASFVIGDSYDDKKNLNRNVNLKDGTALFSIYFNKLLLCYLFGRHKMGQQYALNADKLKAFYSGSFTLNVFFFIDTLNRLALFKSSSYPARLKIMARVFQNLKKIEKCGKHSPENHKHRVYLIKAEIARVLGRDEKAMNYYDLSIDLAKQNDFLQDQAIANELAAKFWLGKKKVEFSSLYMKNAHGCYLDWGAVSKAKEIAKKYPALVAERGKTGGGSPLVSQGPKQGAMERLDLATVIKASQAVSSEIVLSKFLEKMIKIVMQNAGAEKGFFILENKGRLFVEAEADTWRKDVPVLRSIPVESHGGLSKAIVHYVFRVHEPVITDNASTEERFANDSYVNETGPKSILCVPITVKGRLSAILYLENNLTTGAFTHGRVRMIELLVSQASISFENVRLYDRLVKNQKRLKSSEEKYRTILRSIEDGYWEVDIPGTYTFFNQSMCKILGYSKEELSGMNFRNFLDDENQKKIHECFNNVFKTGEAAQGIEHEIIRGNGNSLSVEASVSLILDPSEKPIGFRGVTRDITQRKRVENLKIEKEIAEAAARSKSAFLANMSHELRTPLNPIIGMSRMALNMELNPKARRYLGIIQNSAKLLLGIVNDVLDFSKIEAGRLDMESIGFFLDDIVSNLTEMFGQQLEDKGIHMNVSIESDVPTRLKGDPLRLGQILSNLVSNAVKFTERGQISILVKCLNKSEETAALQFSVEDTGIGINEEDIKKLFNVFTQVDSSTTRKFGGSGLGLAICKRLVKLMGGKIWAQSKTGKGTKFFFTANFTLNGDEASGGESLSPAQDDMFLIKNRLRGATILLVEDNEINQEVAYELLQDAGIMVEVAGNGDEAVEAVKEKHFDCILMDVQMPVMDGFEATNNIRLWEKDENHTARLPIIAMTAHTMKEDRDRCIASGMDDYVGKPVSPEVLFPKLDAWIKDFGKDPGSEKPFPAAERVNDKFSDWPSSLPGIELEAGLARVAGKKKIFINLLNSFSRKFKNIAAEIRSEIQKGEMTRAHELAHNFKGVAGNVSAVRLYMVADELVSAIRKEDTAVALKLLEEMERSLNQVIGSIDRLNADFAALKDMEKGRDGKEKSLGKEEVSSILLKMASLIRGNDSETEDYLVVFKESLGSLLAPGELSRLEKEINNFNFRHAQITLTEIAKSMNISI